MGHPSHFPGGDSDSASDPSLTRFLLSDTRLAWVWLGARAYLGWVWALSGISVLREVSQFTTGRQMTSLDGPLAGDVVRLQPVVPILLGASELVVGLLLVLGVFTGLTAFISVVLSVNTLYPGPAATDPVAFAATILLILAWRVSGWYGVDRWLLRDRATPRGSRASKVTKGKR